MSVKTKKYLITTRQREAIIVRQKNSGFWQYCEGCQEITEMKTLDAATFETGRSTRELFYLTESNLLHSVETPRGHLLICDNSLKNLGNPKSLKTAEEKNK